MATTKNLQLTVYKTGVDNPSFLDFRTGLNGYTGSAWDNVTNTSNMNKIDAFAELMTGYVGSMSAAIALRATLLSPALTGTPTAPTNMSNTPNTQIATGEFVARYVGSFGGSGGTTLSGLGITASAAELNILDGVTTSTAELNILDGVTVSTAELNYLDGVTSDIQSQLDDKAGLSHSHATATTATNGYMGSTDKTILTELNNMTTSTITATWVGTVAPFTQTIVVSGMTSAANPVISPVYDINNNTTALAQQVAWGCVDRITTQSGSILCVCFSTKPTTAIPIQIKGY